jgi:hypothetical protein
MKIIRKSNFDKESINDLLIAENVNEFYLSIIVDALNNKFSGIYAPNYFQAVMDDYKLYVWEP